MSFSTYPQMTKSGLYFFKFESYFQRVKSFFDFESWFGEDYFRINPWIFLALAIVLAVAGALYPYSRAINPDSLPVGADVPLYVDWMKEVEKNPYQAFVVEGGSRPLILLLIYVVEHVFGFSTLDIVKFLPVLLNPLLVSSVFFMVLRGSEDLE